MTSRDPQSQRFLVIAPQGLGDSLEATPMLRALRSAQPGARIDVAVMRAGPKLLFEALAPTVDEVVYLPFWERGKLAFLRELARERSRPPYDCTFLAYPAARAEYYLLAYAFPARRRFAHRYWDPSPTNFLWLFTDLVPVEQKHNVLRNMDLLAAAGIPFETPANYAAPAAWIAPAQGRRPGTIAVHVGSIAHDGLDNKRWPLPYFVEVAAHFVARGFRVEAVMGADERAETLDLVGRVPGVSIVEGRLPDVARHLSTVDVVVCNDSGIGHLAAAVGTRVVALFGPTPVEFAPFGANATVLRPSDCPPCFDPRLLNTNCARNIDYRCLRKDLTPAYVIETVERVCGGGSVPVSSAV
ncbi:MAG: glycosyltransferase family 9 protein [Vulcanimicrobiaceae bacterium]